MIRNEENKAKITGGEGGEKAGDKRRVRVKEVAYVRKTGELETYLIEEAIPADAPTQKRSRKNKE